MPTPIFSERFRLFRFGLSVTVVYTLLLGTLDFLLRLSRLTRSTALPLSGLSHFAVLDVVVSFIGISTEFSTYCINALMNISIHIPPSVSGRAPYVNLQTEFINTFNFVNHAQYVYFEADRLHGLLINFPAPSYPFFRAGLCFDLLVASPGAMCCREFFSLWFILTDPLVLYLWCVFFLGTLTKLDVLNISMVSPTVVNLLPASLSVQGGFVVPNYAFFLSFLLWILARGILSHLFVCRQYLVLWCFSTHANLV